MFNNFLLKKYMNKCNRLNKYFFIFYEMMVLIMILIDFLKCVRY